MLFRLLRNVKRWAYKIWNAMARGPKNMEWPS